MVDAMKYCVYIQYIKLSLLNAVLHRSGTLPLMIERTDLVTASRVELALILLPMIGWLKTSYTLAASGVPLEIAVRVMVLPQARRPTRPVAFLA
jgi:hypothetical protein